MNWKPLLLIVCLVLLALIVAAYVFLSTYDFNTLKPKISQAVKNATGRDLILEGDLELRVGLALGLSVEGVRFENAPWGSRKDLAKMERAEGQVALLPLLFRRIELKRLILIEPDILFETDDSGRLNLAFEPVRKPEAKKLAREAKTQPFPLKEIRLEKGMIAHRDGRSGRTFGIEVESLSVSASNSESPIELDLKGMLNDRSFELGGTVGPLASLTDSSRPWPVSVRFKASGTTARLEGAIRDVGAAKGLTLTFTTRGKSTSDVFELAGLETSPDLGPFAALIKFSDTEGGLSAEELDLQVGKKDLVELGINGSIRNVLALSGIDLTLTVQGQDLAKLEKPLRRPLPLKGPFSVSGKVVDSGDKTYRLRDLEGILGSSKINGWVQLNLGGTRSRVTADLKSEKFDFRPLLISESGKSQFIENLPPLGPIQLAGTISDPFGKLAVEDLNLRLGISDLFSIGISGSIQNPGALRGIRLSFEAEGKDLANLETLLGKALPLKGPFSLSGQLTDSTPDTFSFNNLEAVLGKNQLHGTVDINLVGKEPKVTASLSSPQLHLRPVAASEIADLPWVDTLLMLGAIQARTTLSAPSGKLTVEELYLQIGTEDLTRMRINGSIDDASAFRGLNLSFVIEGKDLANLEKLIGRPWPFRGAFSVSGKVNDLEDRIYSFSGIKGVFEQNEFDVSAELYLVGEKPKVELAVFSKALDLQSSLDSDLSESPWVAAVSHLEPMNLAVAISDPTGELVVEQLDLRLGTEDLAEVRINGAVKDPMTMGGMDLTLTIKGRDLANLHRVLGHIPPFEGPFAVSARVVNPAEKMYRIQDFKSIVGDNDLRGGAQLDLAGERPHITAELSSERIDLRPVLAREESESTEDTKPSEAKPKERKIFPSESLPVDILTPADVDLKLRAERFLLPGGTLGDLALDFSLANGHLITNSLNCTVGGGTAEGNFDLRVKDKEIELHTDLAMSQLNLGLMLEELGVNPLVDGTVSAEVGLSGCGDSVAALMARLAGETTLIVSEGWVNNNYVSMVGGDIISQMLQLVNPPSHEEKRTEFKCHVNHFEIKDGVAKCRVWVSDTKHTTVIGGGQINLKTEGLKLVFKLSPKKGIGHSSVGKLSVSLGKLATMVKIGGTLADPSLAINPTGVGVTVGKALGGMALFGPLGLGAAFIDVSRGDKDPCATAIRAAQEGGQITYDKEEENQAEDPR